MTGNAHNDLCFRIKNAAAKAGFVDDADAFVEKIAVGEGVTPNSITDAQWEMCVKAVAAGISANEGWNNRW